MPHPTEPFQPTTVAVVSMPEEAVITTKESLRPLPSPRAHPYEQSPEPVTKQNAHRHPSPQERTVSKSRRRHRLPFQRARPNDKLPRERGTLDCTFLKLMQCTHVEEDAQQCFCRVSIRYYGPHAGARACTASLLIMAAWAEYLLDRERPDTKTRQMRYSYYGVGVAL